jgi:hypothetical protein
VNTSLVCQMSHHKGALVRIPSANSSSGCAKEERNHE